MNKCKCCGNLTIEEYGKYEICENCGWEDDLHQNEDPNYSGGANALSLNDYRRKVSEEKPSI